MPITATRRDWREQAGCATEGAGLWETGQYGGYPPGVLPFLLSICASCPVRERCLADQVAWEQATQVRPGKRWGIFGGTTPAQRDRDYPVVKDAGFDPDADVLSYRKCVEDVTYVTEDEYVEPW